MIIRQCLRSGAKLPDFIANAPDLAPGLALYFNAFLELSGSRQVGMSEGPIPWTAVHEYARWMELSEDQTDDLHTLIGHMDRAYLKHRREQNGN